MTWMGSEPRTLIRSNEADGAHPAKLPLSAGPMQALHAVGFMFLKLPLFSMAWATTAYSAAESMSDIISLISRIIPDAVSLTQINEKFLP